MPRGRQTKRPAASNVELFMECFEDELSVAQLKANKQADLEFKAALKKIEEAKAANEKLLREQEAEQKRILALQHTPSPIVAPIRSTSPDVIIVDEEPARRTHTLPSSTPINKLRNSQPHGVRQGQSAVRSPAPIPTNLLRPAGGHNPVTVRHAGVMRQPLVIQPAPNINVSDFNRQNIRFAGNTARLPNILRGQGIRFQGPVPLSMRMVTPGNARPTGINTELRNEMIYGAAGQKRAGGKMDNVEPARKTQRRGKSAFVNQQVQQQQNAGTLVPLDEYYYGKKEGDPAYREEKGEYRFKCWFCHKMLYNNLRIMMHMQGHIDSEKQQNLDLSDLTQCKHCYKQFDTPFEMQCHVEKIHQNKSNVLVCRICEKDHDNQAMLRLHMKQYHNACEMPYMCQLCNFRSSIYSDVVDHFRKRHDSSVFVLCLYCLKIFRVNFSKNGGWGMTANYYQHLQKHQAKASKKCSCCKLTFLGKPDAKLHRNKDHLANYKGILGTSSGTTITHDKEQVMICLPDNSGGKKVIKSLNAPVSSKIQEMNLLQLNGVTLQHKCVECRKTLLANDHFRKYVECSMCRYATICSHAYASHMMGFHSGDINRKKSVIPKGRRIQLMYCLCGFSSKNGNVIANHLISCSKRTCYAKKPEVKWFEYDDEQEDYNPFEAYPEELDAPGKDESPARDVPSLFGALGLVKRPSKAETTRLKSKIIAKKGSEAADDKVTDLSGPKKWDKVRIKDQKLPDKHSIFLGGPESKKGSPTKSPTKSYMSFHKKSPKKISISSNMARVLTGDEDVQAERSISAESTETAETEQEERMYAVQGDSLSSVTTVTTGDATSQNTSVVDALPDDSKQRDDSLSPLTGFVENDNKPSIHIGEKLNNDDISSEQPMEEKPTSPLSVIPDNSIPTDSHEDGDKHEPSTECAENTESEQSIDDKVTDDGNCVDILLDDSKQTDKLHKPSTGVVEKEDKPSIDIGEKLNDISSEQPMEEETTSPVSVIPDSSIPIDSHEDSDKHEPSTECAENTKSEQSIDDKITEHGQCIDILPDDSNLMEESQKPLTGIDIVEKEDKPSIDIGELNDISSEQPMEEKPTSPVSVIPDSSIPTDSHEDGDKHESSTECTENTESEQSIDDKVTDDGNRVDILLENSKQTDKLLKPSTGIDIVEKEDKPSIDIGELNDISSEQPMEEKPTSPVSVIPDSSIPTDSHEDGDKHEPSTECAENTESEQSIDDKITDDGNSLYVLPDDGNQIEQSLAPLTGIDIVEKEDKPSIDIGEKLNDISSEQPMETDPTSPVSVIPDRQTIPIDSHEDSDKHEPSTECAENTESEQSIDDKVTDDGNRVDTLPENSKQTDKLLKPLTGIVEKEEKPGIVISEKLNDMSSEQPMEEKPTSPVSVIPDTSIPTDYHEDGDKHEPSTAALADKKNEKNNVQEKTSDKEEEVCSTLIPNSQDKHSNIIANKSESRGDKGENHTRDDRDDRDDNIGSGSKPHLSSPSSQERDKHHSKDRKQDDRNYKDRRDSHSSHYNDSKHDSRHYRDHHQSKHYSDDRHGNYDRHGGWDRDRSRDRDSYHQQGRNYDPYHRNTDRGGYRGGNRGGRGWGSPPNQNRGRGRGNYRGNWY